MAEHRAELHRAGAGLWHVRFHGEQIVTASPDPEPEACRTLHARGITGRVRFVHLHGTPAGGLDVETGAAKVAKATEAE